MRITLRLAVCLGTVALVAALCLNGATAAAQDETPDPELKPTFGEVKLKAGFTPDPFKKEVIAGGPIKTNLGGVAAYVSKAPDFKLYYAAGNFPLTIHVDSNEDTTLLINLPDGKWVAVDDSEDGKNLNPVMKFEKPQSGRYDIYVGTFKKENAKATLFITELK